MAATIALKVTAASQVTRAPSSDRILIRSIATPLSGRHDESANCCLQLRRKRLQQVHARARLMLATDQALGVDRDVTEVTPDLPAAPCGELKQSSGQARTTAVTMAVVHQPHENAAPILACSGGRVRLIGGCQISNRVSSRRCKRLGGGSQCLKTIRLHSCRRTCRQP